MTIDLKSFGNAVILSIFGFAFYYLSLFFDIMSTGLLPKVLAMAILIISIPLPIIAVHGNNVFKGVNKGFRNLIILFTIGTVFHHAVMTFLIIMFTSNAA